MEENSVREFRQVFASATKLGRDLRAWRYFFIRVADRQIHTQNVATVATSTILQRSTTNFIVQ